MALLDMLLLQRNAPLANFVEKLRISDVANFRKEPVIQKCQMKFAMRRSELPRERYRVNLAEPLASKCWSSCKDKNFTDFPKNRVFQHNLREDEAARAAMALVAGVSR